MYVTGVGFALQLREEKKKVRAELAKARRKHQQELADVKQAERKTAAEQDHDRAMQLKLEREHLMLNVTADTGAKPGGGRPSSGAAAGARGLQINILIGC